MSDLISRQDAINAIHKDILFKPLDNGTFYRESNEFVPIGYVERILLALPSAQPEQTMGKWIVRTRHEHFPSGKEYTELVCPFCGRTDHNGDGIFCGYCGCKMEVEDETD